MTGMHTVVHCHHYNSRIQNTIESIKHFDGAEIFRNSADICFAKFVKNAVEQLKVERAEILQVAQNLYSYLGFGNLEIKKGSNRIAQSKSSHFVEGWSAGFEKENRKICTFTEGYLQGALHALDGAVYEVREVQCMNEGADRCEFEYKLSNQTRDYAYLKGIDCSELEAHYQNEACQNTSVDSQKIIDAVFSLPLFGNEEGLIPAFNVYLSHMPRDFYNLVTLNLLQRLDEIGMRAIGFNLLVEDAENCGLNTFSGIMNSDEWASLIQPMITETKDNIYALVAVANALGWGNMRITEHVPEISLTLETANSYEAIGAMEIIGNQASNHCPMLCGVSAGLMELIYLEGEFGSRQGKYTTLEDCCIAVGDHLCRFKTKLVKE